MLQANALAGQHTLPRRRWIGLGILCFIAVLGATSQTLPSILVQPIKSDLRMSDTVIGLINGLGVSVIAAIAAFPIGWAADLYGRRLLLAASIVVWSVSVLVAGMAQSADTFAIGAVGISLGDAALFPLLYALVASSFTGKDRDTANTILVAAILLGAFGVYTLGGLMLSFFEQFPLGSLAPWRSVCVAVAATGIVAIICLPIVHVRTTESRSDETLSKREDDFAPFIRREGKTIIALYSAISIFYVAYSVFMFWAPAILEREFGLASAQANIAIGTPLTLTSLCAIVATTLSLRWTRARWGDAAALRMLIWGCVIMLPGSAALLFVTDANSFIWASCAVIFGMTIAMMLVPLLLQSCAPDSCRSRTIALFSLVLVLLRIVLPALVGWLSDEYADVDGALLTIIATMLVISLLLSIVAMRVMEPGYVALAGRVRSADC